MHTIPSAYEGVFFQKEAMSQSLFEEVTPLLKRHWDEVAHFKDIPLNPEFETYLKLDQMGLTRMFTARDGSGSLLGYAVFVVKSNMHYRDSIQATQDIIFIDKEKRGFGTRFIDWCDNELRKEGVQAVYHHVKKAHDWSKILTKLNYQMVDTIWARRLDG